MIVCIELTMYNGDVGGECFCQIDACCGMEKFNIT